MTYTPTTWVNGTTPVNATNMNHIETYLGTVNSAATDANISADGSGILTLIGLILSGNGKIVLPNPSAQTLTTGNTITIPGVCVVVTTGGNVTGIIMTAGTTTGQIIFLYQSSSAGTVTFAAASSNVRGGSNTILNTGRLYIGRWDGTSWAFTGS